MAEPQQITVTGGGGSSIEARYYKLLDELCEDLRQACGMPEAPDDPPGGWDPTDVIRHATAVLRRARGDI